MCRGALLETSNAQKGWPHSLKVCWSNNQTVFRVDRISVNLLQVAIDATLWPNVECPQYPRNGHEQVSFCHMETWADTSTSTKCEVKTPRRVLTDCVILCKSQVRIQAFRIEVSWVFKSVMVQGPNLLAVLMCIPPFPTGWLERRRARFTHIHHHYRTFGDSLAMIRIILLCCMRYSTTNWTGGPWSSSQSQHLHTSDETSNFVQLTPQCLLHNPANVRQIRSILPKR